LRRGDQLLQSCCLSNSAKHSAPLPVNALLTASPHVRVARMSPSAASPAPHHSKRPLPDHQLPGPIAAPQCFYSSQYRLSTVRATSSLPDDGCPVSASSNSDGRRVTVMNSVCIVCLRGRGLHGRKVPLHMQGHEVRLICRASNDSKMAR